MRGRTDQQPTMFVMINVEARVPADHPLRAIKKRCTAILAAMRRDFDAAYSQTGRPSILRNLCLSHLGNATTVMSGHYNLTCHFGASHCT